MPPATATPIIDEVLVDWSPGETRVALLHDGRPWELLVSRTSRPTNIGNVYLGRVVGTDRGLDAVFVDVGQGSPGMLRLPRANRTPHEGERLVVQVTRDAYADKGPALTASIRLAGRYVVLTPGRPGIAASRRIADPEARQRLQGLVKRATAPEEGVVIRTAAAVAGEAELARELEQLRSAWRAIEGNAAGGDPPVLLHSELAPPLAFLRDALPPTPVPVSVDDRQTLATLNRFVEANLPDYSGLLALHAGSAPLFEERQVESEIEAVCERDWPLADGGSIAIERTRALTAIDVDTGSGGGRRSGGSDRKAVNMAAAREAARLIRFRNLSGLIAVDFAGSGPEAADRAVVGALRGGFTDDRAAVRFGSPSEFGLLVMSRERLGPSLFELLAGEAPRSWTTNAETRLLSGLRSLVRLRPPPPECRLEVSHAEADLLEGRLSDARREAEQRLGYPVLVSRLPPG